MKPITSLHTVDETNLGEQVCNPCKYRPKLKHATVQNIWEDKPVSDGPVIVGGGGLLHGPLLPRIAAIQQAPRIAWGIGSNRHGATSPLEDYNALVGFDLIGIRDWPLPTTQPNWHHVPCASCLHPAFDAPRPAPVLPFVVYNHSDYPVDLPWFATESNKADANSMEAAISFLALGEKVLTSSYHGAYWAMLIGRPVVIWKPFSSKFYTFEHAPIICDETNWVEKIRAATPPPSDFLSRCRDANMAFYEKVAKVLGLE